MPRQTKEDFLKDTKERNPIVDMEETKGFEDDIQELIKNAEAFQDDLVEDVNMIDNDDLIHLVNYQRALIKAVKELDKENKKSSR